MTFTLLMVLAVVSAALQAKLPAIGGLRLELLPAIVAVAALSLRRGPALLLALIAGFSQDALSAAPFGLTALAYGIVASLLTGLRDSFDRDLPWVQMAAGGLMSAVASLAALCVVGFSPGTILKLLLLTGLSGLIAPIASLAARR